MSTEAIALLGGSFDPVHLGHLQSAKQLASCCGFSDVYLVPCHIPAHRQVVGSAHHRLEMLRLALADFPHLKLDTSEMEKTSPSYTLETLQHWRQKLGEQASITWVLGSDAFAAIDSWHRWQELTEFGNLLVMQRAGEERQSFPAVIEDWMQGKLTGFEQLSQQVSGHIGFVHLKPWHVSSTQLRECLSEIDDSDVVSTVNNNEATQPQKSTVKNLLPTAVWQYIQQHKLYR